MKWTTEEKNMLRTIGYVFVVLLIGTFAIAWSHQKSEKAATLAPNTLHVNTQSLPVQDVNDMTFIYTHEK
jgi:hypothetical protein